MKVLEIKDGVWVNKEGNEWLYCLISIKKLENMLNYLFCLAFILKLMFWYILVFVLEDAVNKSSVLTLPFLLRML